MAKMPAALAAYNAKKAKGKGVKSATPKVPKGKKTK